MNITKFRYLIKKKVVEFDSEEVDFVLLSKYKQLVKDDSYFDFIIESKNGGFFYSQALHIYGYSNVHKFNDIAYINSLLQGEFGGLFNDLISFGQDLFGNQFCFDIAKNNIVFFDSETGERGVIASDYVDWIKILGERLEYFTGINVLASWLLINQLLFNQRLCPKIPFVLGGEFKVDNLYAGQFPDFISAYANIAKQVKALAEGTKVKLNIK
jgi:SMI1/KNR4 family protein SUKH-1